MTEPEEIDEDLFADLYEGDDSAKQYEEPAALQETAPDSPVPAVNDGGSFNENSMQDVPPDIGPPPDEEMMMSNAAYGDGDMGQEWHEDVMAGRRDSAGDNDSHGIGIKEDGKMFIGGLNWETTDQSLKEYFSQYGEVAECTVMRDAATGRSRGFGFLTFRDPKTVNIVMVKEHFLDGKIIDPKRAIPRDEQEKTSKIFVGGVSQEATEQDFKEYFMQYGRVIDATLMMDKDTGRPRGFGFVTFDSEAAVEATLDGDLRILGKPIEVKKAQPRGDMRAEEERGGRGGRRGGREGRYGDDSQGPHHSQNQNQQAMPNGMSPTMMVQYFQKMQQFMAMMAAAQGGGMANPLAMGGMAGMNPAMMQQMKVQQMQAMQQQMQQMQRQGDGQQGMQGMTPQMMQQMQQMMQMQGGEGQGNFANQMGGAPTGPSSGGSSSNGGGRRGTPSYNAQDQLAFEQQKYEQQQRRMGGYQQGGPTSWEGMYDDVPQPHSGGQGGRGRGHGRRGGYQHHQEAPKGPAPAAPANAPTGPKNAGIPGANYRGGRGGGGGGHRGNYHPYRR